METEVLRIRIKNPTTAQKMDHFQDIDWEEQEPDVDHEEFNRTGKVLEYTVYDWDMSKEHFMFNTIEGVAYTFPLEDIETSFSIDRVLLAPVLENGFGTLTYKEIVKLNSGSKVRIRIHTACKKEHCKAEVHFWNGKEWSFVDSIHYSNMNVSTAEKVKSLKGKHWMGSFSYDRLSLIKSANTVLGGI
jgi:hypothetical protein